MEAIHVLAEQAVRLDPPPDAGCTTGFHWLDLTHAEFTANPEALRQRVFDLTGARIFDLHMKDAGNLQHPSFFDSTAEYDMLIFRKLATGETPPLTDLDEPAGKIPSGRRLQEIITRPITFFVFDRLLLTVRNPHSRTIEQVRTRLLEFKSRRSPKDNASARGESATTRLPQRPEDLMLRLLNGMVDRYLELRQPLTDKLDRWQRELLDPRRPFDDWSALLEARIELRRLENLCEEQHDALQELRDAYLESTPEPQQSDVHLVRIADVIEHVNRVLNHARRLETSIESAVQLHFSATAHRTNLVVRRLTVIAAIFAPLTLIAGIWGMNVERLPLAHHPRGFEWIAGGMAALGLALFLYFSIKRFLSDRPTGLRRWWRRRMRRDPTDRARPISAP